MKALSLILALTVTTPCFAEDCSKPLIQDMKSVSSDWAARYSLFDGLSRTDYESLDKSGKLDLLYGDLDAHLNYDETKTFFSQINKITNISSFTRSHTDVLTSELGDNAIKGYIECIHHDDPIYVWVGANDKDFVQISYSMHLPALEQSHFHDFKIFVDGKVVSSDNTLPDASSVHSFNIPRTSHNTISVQLTADIDPGDGGKLLTRDVAIIVPWIPQINISSDTITRTSDDADNKVGGDSQIHIFFKGQDQVETIDKQFGFKHKDHYRIKIGSAVYQAGTYGGGAQGYYGIAKDKDMVTTPLQISGVFVAGNRSNNAGFEANGRVIWQEWRPILKVDGFNVLGDIFD